MVNLEKNFLLSKISAAKYALCPPYLSHPTHIGLSYSLWSTTKKNEKNVV